MEAFISIVVIVIIIIIVNSVHKKQVEQKKEKAIVFRKSALENEKKGNLDQAVIDYTQSIELAPESYRENYMERGDLYRRNEKFDLAIADYTKYVDLERKEIKRKEYLAGAAARLGQSGYDTDTHFNVCSIAYAILLRAEMYEKKGDKKIAKAEYKKSLDNYNDLINFGTSNAFFLACRGDVYAYMGDNVKAMSDYNEAIWKCDKIIAEDPADDSTLRRRSNLYLKIGNKDQAIADLESILQIKLNKADYDSLVYYTDSVESLNKVQDEVRKELETLKQ